MNPIYAIFFFVAVVAGIASAKPAEPIPIVFKSETHEPNGAYNLKYETGDGQAFQETAQVKRNNANDGDVLVKSGFYAYTAADGTPIALSYIADEQGFRVSGTHLPKAPEAL